MVTVTRGYYLGNEKYTDLFAGNVGIKYKTDVGHSKNLVVSKIVAELETGYNIRIFPGIRKHHQNY